MVIGDFQVVDHGIEHNQYFQGCGVAFTSYQYCSTGCGSDPEEAYNDAIEQIAISHDVDLDGFDARVLRDLGKRRFPTRPRVSSRHSDECFYYLSIRYSLKETN